MSHRDAQANSIAKGTANAGASAAFSIVTRAPLIVISGRPICSSSKGRNGTKRAAPHTVSAPKRSPATPAISSSTATMARSGQPMPGRAPEKHNLASNLPVTTSTAHHHRPSATAALSSVAFATTPPPGGKPIRNRAPSPKARTVIVSARPIPASLAIWSWPSASAISPAPMNIPAFATACKIA